MFRDLLSSRAIHVGLVFFVLIVGGTQLYSWHVRRTTAAELERTNRIVQQLENRNKTHTLQDASVPTETEIPEETQTPEETEPLNGLPMDDVSKGVDVAVTEALDLFQNESEAVVAEEGVASDFPEVPADFPENLTPVWVEFPNYQKGDMHDHEIIYRVLIKLWNQGEHGFVNGVFRDNNRRVYPLYPDVVYVRWEEKVVDGPQGPITVRRPRNILGTHRSFTPEEIFSGRIEELYPDVNFVDIDTAGYDPETFITNDEK